MAFPPSASLPNTRQKFSLQPLLIAAQPPPPIPRTSHFPYTLTVFKQDPGPASKYSESRLYKLPTILLLPTPVPPSSATTAWLIPLS